MSSRSRRARPNRSTTCHSSGAIAELAVIDRSIDHAQRGNSQMVVVQGPSGIGKTALLDAVGSDPSRAVRRFACLASDSSYPLFMIHRLTRSLAKSAGLGRLPSLGESVPAAFDRVAEMLDEIGPTIVTIDDLHWADDASQAVIAGLTGSHQVQSLLVIASRRLAEADAVARPEIASSRACVIDLGPLDRTVVEALPIDSAWEETGGHPGVLVTCLESCRTGGHMAEQAIADILDWVGAAQSPARVALEAAAMIGRSFDIHALAGELGLSQPSTRVAARRPAASTPGARRRPGRRPVRVPGRTHTAFLARTPRGSPLQRLTPSASPCPRSFCHRQR